ncbi:homing endonuclease [Sinorhizobium phage phiM9]|uniref:Putative homing endonuclease n=1 Tax=Sinorhizobium phage phiM9 TaxID=1636182 RepID=A0A0F6R547_9CAUD|nr:homing endonuclease [Sinorhizobium phage phiM9]AKE44852.1 putative homing endonuclease [Sinorhizobium phage phiM9]
MFGFIYLTTNLINGKKYVGRRNGDPTKDSHYLGSGTLLNRAIEKYGRKNFKRETLQICENAKELFEAEEEWIRHFDAVKSENFYNLLATSAGWGPGHKKTQEHIDRVAASHRGMKRNKETCRRISEKKSGVDNLKKRKSFKIMDPEGRVHEICGLKKFCDEYGLQPSAISGVVNGHITHHKNWRRVSSESGI